MVLAVCGGSPGEKDGLDPGNGATGSAAAGGTASQDCGSAAGSGDESGSAQNNPSAAAEAALQVLARLRGAHDAVFVYRASSAVLVDSKHARITCGGAFARSILHYRFCCMALGRRLRFVLTLPPLSRSIDRRCFVAV